MVGRWLVLCVSGLWAGMLPCPVSGEDFTFRSVKPPAAGTTRRITIQIDKTWPHETDPATSASREVPNELPLPEDWFWQAVSPNIAAADASRLNDALTILNENPGKMSGIDKATLEDIIREHGATILKATAGKRVSPALVLAVIAVESHGRKAATSAKGAHGLMQLMPATARRFGAEDRSDPAQNIAAGTRYLDWLLKQFKGDPILLLAGYNAGESAIKRHNGVPPFAETRAYVPKVLATWVTARMYCMTLPRRVDDGCVFAFERSLVR